ncbi:MAG TPA: ABC-2 family transporter protein [Opitutaceae bacterium]|nr:ABC-2 family transporter protein [Opitutaceae bacterium]
MSGLLHYAKLWLACVRYSIVRTMMFRGDFFMWSLVELFWMSVNLLLIGVIYRHTDSIAGWNQWEMTLLVGTSLLIQRLLMGFFWSNLFEMGRNVRSGAFDFFIAQPGHLLFMVSTRKIDLDGFLNVPIALGVIVYSLRQLGLDPSALQILSYALFILCGLFIHYATLLIFISLVFWLQSAKGVEGGYFMLNEFSRLPRTALRGVASIVFVYTLPVAIVTNIPSQTLLHGVGISESLWMLGVTAFWLAVSITVFHRGIRRYTSASS